MKACQVHKEAAASPTLAETEHSLYQPLPPQCTRVVHLSRFQPSRAEHSDLQLHLVLCHLPESPPDGVLRAERSLANHNPTNYVALSYTWGEGQDKEKVPISILDEQKRRHTITITRSLKVALAHISDYTPFCLWVDQISIDQSSTAERASQISLMRRIYEGASLVLVWLGDARNDSGLAFSKLSSIATAYRSDLEHITKSPADEHNLDDIVTVLDQIHGPLSADTLLVWKAVATILERAWFSRAWIWQEATAIDGNHTVVCCGSSVLSMDDLSMANFSLSIFKTGPLPAEFEFLRAAKTDPLLKISGFNYQRRQTRARFSLRSLLHDLRLANATDPRDKVYCMLGFATDVDGTNQELEADYNVTVQTTFTNFVLWYIRRHGSLDFLADCVPDRGKWALPSWVPNWTIKDSAYPIRRYQYSKDPDSPALYCASGSSHNEVNLSKCLPAAATLLALSGVSVATVGETLETSFDIGNADVERSWQPRDETQICRLNRMSLGQVFARTIAADQGVSGDRAEAKIGRGHYVNLGPKPLQYWENTDLKAVTWRRCLFYTAAAAEPGEEGTGLMGLGPHQMEPGDEIWMFKGGKMLHVVRHVTAKEAGSGWVLDLTGDAPGQRCWNAGDILNVFIGECFIYGLMDGEILDFWGDEPSRERPPALRDMDREFRTIYLN